MPTLPLTDQHCKALKPTATRQELRDTKVPGLILRCTPSNIKSWSLRYADVTGKHVRMTIGRYPAVSLSDARTAALQVLAEVSTGKDPVADRKAAQAAEKAAREAATALTVEKIGNDYFEAAAKGRHRPKGKPKKPSTLGYERGYFDSFVLPKFGKSAIGDLHRRAVQTFIDGLADDHNLSTGVQSLKVLRQICAYAEFQELISANPCRFVEATDYDSRERVLTDAELKAIWKALENPYAIASNPQAAIAVRICAATAQRRAEVAKAELSELDFDNAIWTMPGSRRKNGRTHIVPLSDLAVQLLRAAIALHEDGYKGAAVFPPLRGEGAAMAVENLTRCFAAAAEAAGVKDTRLHDLRRTAATNMTGERLTIARSTVSLCLGHDDGANAAAATRVYDRYGYLPEKRRALTAWASLLLEIVGETEALGNVVALRRA
ncbi:tyrosine-type recombinase/integrase [Roseibium alexandrii]|uniref:Site-specific recombinase XerD n=1 Tax=Roseibium alexandrii (strain DSM 17067 / NCIMB 14079 / DFL-11) TaxID=244592 RepID=A0A5E8GXV3_ROSAD|nr:site-specific integrase [Roseibium alexandrii]EEE44910.1 Site-specific recombinase XerD [Roseibium alexandrii DFL-11]